jgi:hypothetical protein
MEALGFNLRQEAVLQTLTADVLTSSEIEGEKLDAEQVRSSIARRLGMDIGGLKPADRNVEGVVEMMLDATCRYDQPLTAERSQVLFNDLTGNPTGFSYACYRDVSELIKMYPVVAGENHHTGNANYTVGDVTGSTGEYISYAGWSLIIVYWSPSSAGHYFYLRDVFSYNSGTQNLDFDGDGLGGGDVEGFVIPEPIRNRDGVIIETNAAKLTCFVGEGDAAYLGDSATMTGQNGFTYALYNSVSPVNNIWNSTSPGLTCPGVDIDTFEVPWSSGILVPGDTWLHLDLPSGAINVDAWNLIYIIVSVRSKTVIGATGHYIISTN